MRKPHEHPTQETPPTGEPVWPGKYWTFPNIGTVSKADPYSPFASQQDRTAALEAAHAQFMADHLAWWLALHPQTDA